MNNKQRDRCIECVASLLCFTGTHFDVVLCYECRMVISVSTHSSNRGTTDFFEEDPGHAWMNVATRNAVIWCTRNSNRTNWTPIKYTHYTRLCDVCAWDEEDE